MITANAGPRYGRMHPVIFAVALCILNANAQQGRSGLDSIAEELHHHPAHDSMRVMLLASASKASQLINVDSGIAHAREGIRIAETIGFRRGQAECLFALGVCYELQARYPEALQYIMQSLRIMEDIRDARGTARAIGQIGIIYHRQEIVDKALEYYRKALAMYEAIGDQAGIASQLSSIGIAYRARKDYVQSLDHYSRALQIARALHDSARMVALFGNIGNNYSSMARYPEALDSYGKSLELAEALGLRLRAGQILSNMGFTYLQMVRAAPGAKADSHRVRPGSVRWRMLLKGLEYTNKAVDIGKEMNDTRGLADRYQNLAEIRAAMGDFQQAYRRGVQAAALHDSIFNAENRDAFTKLEQRRINELREKELAILQERETGMRNMLLGGTVAILLLAALVFLRVAHQRRATELRAEAAEHQARALQAENERQEAELRQAHELEIAYRRLQHTQAQLIQQEKLASLGQLTAGIAHEIKNPLNFINNFSEVSSDLAEEFLSASSEQDRARLGGELRQTLEKITEHGKRADTIVRSMMLHARGGEGERRPSDINTLLHDAAQLTFHGMRARYQDFTTAIRTRFDDDLRPCLVYPQELFRVFLNILDNACHAVRERAIRASDSEWDPVIEIGTSRIEGYVRVEITDNGPGIPADLQERIFEPFVTTRSAGQGTGLGLSISYDIVNKTHGGRLTVTSVPGSGSTFTVDIPFIEE